MCLQFRLRLGRVILIHFTLLCLLHLNLRSGFHLFLPFLVILFFLGFCPQCFPVLCVGCGFLLFHYSVTSFYLSNAQFSSSPGFSLGPVVAAGSVVSDFNDCCFYPFLYILYSWEWVPSGGGGVLSLSSALRCALFFVEGSQWQFCCPVVPGLANSL